MLRNTACVLVFASMILTLPTGVSARCYNVGTPHFYCDPIVLESLKRRYKASQRRPAYRPPTRFTYEGRNYSFGGYNRYKYKYSDSLGNRYRGTIETFPGGAVRHRGRWR